MGGCGDGLVLGGQGGDALRVVLGSPDGLVGGDVGALVPEHSGEDHARLDHERVLITGLSREIGEPALDGFTGLVEPPELDQDLAAQHASIGGVVLARPVDRDVNLECPAARDLRFLRPRDAEQRLGVVLEQPPQRCVRSRHVLDRSSPALDQPL